MHAYPVSPPAVISTADSVAGAAGGGELLVAVRLRDLVSPLRDGRPLGAGDRTALVVAGTERIRSGEPLVFLKVVAAAPARVRRDGQVQAQGSPCDHVTLGPLEDWLDAHAGPGVIDGIADRAELDPEFVKGERQRLLSRAFVIRAEVLMTLMPDADVREVILALAGDLAMVPWAKRRMPASPRAFGDWQQALGPAPLEELQDVVHRASHAGHEHRPGPAEAEADADGEGRGTRRCVTGRSKGSRLRVRSADGTLIRVPDTAANRAAFGSVGTSDDSSPFPQVRALPLTDAVTRARFAMPYGPAGTDKAEAEQKLLDRALLEYEFLFTKGEIWLFDRNFPGAPRIRRLMERTHVLIRVKSDIRLTPVSPVLADSSYLATITGDGVTVTVRVIEYCVHMEGQVVPEMFCLITDLMDIAEYPAADLAGLYRWRWDGSETALRETKSALDGAGPGTGPMFRSRSPHRVRQELAAWSAGTEMNRGVTRDSARVAVPARRGRRAGQPVQPRQISFTAARRFVLAAIRSRRTGYAALTAAISRCRVVIDRDRHRLRASKSPSVFPHTGPGTPTRTAEAIITLANA